MVKFLEDKKQVYVPPEKSNEKTTDEIEECMICLEGFKENDENEKIVILDCAQVAESALVPTPTTVNTDHENVATER